MSQQRRAGLTPHAQFIQLCEPAPKESLVQVNVILGLVSVVDILSVALSWSLHLKIANQIAVLIALVFEVVTRCMIWTTVISKALEYVIVHSPVRRHRYSSLLSRAPPHLRRISYELWVWTCLWLSQLRFRAYRLRSS